MAERINNVGASSYKIKVTSGGDITLDVGNGGKVTVSGDLDVQGHVEASIDAVRTLYQFQPWIVENYVKNEQIRPAKREPLRQFFL